jgi:hypothetical protein
MTWQIFVLSVLSSLIAAELLGILDWSLRGLVAWFASMINEPALSSRLHDEWIAELGHISGVIGKILFVVPLISAVWSSNRGIQDDRGIAGLLTELQAYDTRRNRKKNSGVWPISLEKVAHSLQIPLAKLAAMSLEEFDRRTNGRYPRITTFESRFQCATVGDYNSATARAGDAYITPPKVIGRVRWVGWVICIFIGHDTFSLRFHHFDHDVRSHWRFRRCRRCRLTGCVVAEPCASKQSCRAEATEAEETSDLAS